MPQAHNHTAAFVRLLYQTQQREQSIKLAIGVHKQHIPQQVAARQLGLSLKQMAPTTGCI